jgi:hypothetical protein
LTKAFGRKHFGGIHSALLEGTFDSTAFITVYKKKFSNKDQDIFLLMSKTNKKKSESDKNKKQK